MRIRTRAALNPGTGGPQRDPTVPKELAARAVERGVVAVDIAQVNPGADDVAEVHAAFVQQAFCCAEHTSSLFECSIAGAVEVRRIQRRLVLSRGTGFAGGTDARQPCSRSPAAIACAGACSLDIAHRPHPAVAR